MFQCWKWWYCFCCEICKWLKVKWALWIKPWLAWRSNEDTWRSQTWSEPFRGHNESHLKTSNENPKIWKFAKTTQSIPKISKDYLKIYDEYWKVSEAFSKISVTYLLCRAHLNGSLSLSISEAYLSNIISFTMHMDSEYLRSRKLSSDTYVGILVPLRGAICTS